ncbi:MAG: tetratricopeptide repeat protein [Acidobacteria bacterium]|nr:tetratricopeptide repeat protein [Acidobacteriota bacterium]
MKKETIITAIVFFGVGFLSGYIYDAQKNWSAQQRAAAVPHTHEGETGAAARQPTGTPAGGALPEGHPPIDISAVVKALEEEAARHPRDPQPRLKLANYLYDHSQWLQAIEWYQRALELDPKNVNARTDLGTSYFNAGRAQNALREYRKTLEIDPNHEPTIFNTIVVNVNGTRDLDAAQQAWERLSKLNPSYPGLDRIKQALDGARAAARP